MKEYLISRIVKNSDMQNKGIVANNLHKHF